MDKEKAKFILQSYRPDGADAHDSDFAEALELAAEDRELGEWLAIERAQDAAFAAALSAVEIPDDLREAIFAMIDGGSEEISGLDAEFIGALAGVTPPEGLRDQILNAMEVEQKVVRPSSGWNWRKTSSAMAACVALILGLLFMFGRGGNAIASSTVGDVHESAISMLQAPLFSLDLTDTRQATLYEWLKGQDLPAPENLPEGLRGLDGVGCKYLTIGGDPNARGSLVCYRKSEDTIVHIVMMKKEKLGENIQGFANADEICGSCPNNEKWAVTQWSDDEHAFFMLAKMDPKELAALF